MKIVPNILAAHAGSGYDIVGDSVGNGKPKVVE